MPELAGRLHDLEHHFLVTRSTESKITQTLVDVPYDKRKELKPKTSSVNWPQRRAMLEALTSPRTLHPPEMVRESS